MWVQEEHDPEEEKEEFDDDLVARAETDFFDLIEKERKKQEREQEAKTTEQAPEGDEKQDIRKVCVAKLGFVFMQKQAAKMML